MLPIDIIDYIFSFLQSEPDALEACAIAHHAFSQLVERHLYAHITFDRDNFYYCNSTRELGVSRILSQSPHVANYTRNLDIYISAFSLEFRIPLDIISSALALFPHLQKIKLVLTGAGVSWRDLPQNFRSAFIKCLGLPSMKEVCIGESDFPLSVLNDCKTIKKLTFDRLVDCHDFEAHSAYPQPELLSIFHCERRCLSNLIPWAKSHFSCLHSLKFRLSHEGDLFVLPELLGLCSNTLTTLDLELSFTFWTKYDHDDDISSIPPMFSGLIHLKQLTIRTPMAACIDSLTKNGVLNRNGWRQSSLPAVSQLLKNAPPLRLLILHFHICLGATRSLAEYDWSFLFLLFTDAYPPFRRICLRVTDQVYPNKYLSTTRILDALSHHKKLMLLVRKGALIIDKEYGLQERRI